MKSSKSLISASKEQSSPPKSPGSLYKNKSLPVYSDFSHMSAANGGIGTVMFAVGLREDNAEEMIKRVFPMTKIIPSPVKEKKIVQMTLFNIFTAFNKPFLLIHSFLFCFISSR